MKKILSLLLIAAFLAVSAVILSSCDRPEIFNLLEALLDNRQDNSSYSFDGEINIKINKAELYRTGVLLDFGDAELDIMPDYINIRLSGSLQHIGGAKVCNASINLNLEEHNLAIFILDNILYFENGVAAEIILNLLAATGFVDYSVMRVFRELAFDEHNMIRVDLRDFDLSWFAQYERQVRRTFELESSLDIRLGEMPEIIMPDLPALDFSEIKSRVERRLLSVPGHRYSELRMIICPDNYLHVLAFRENGTHELLAPFKLNIDAAGMTTHENIFEAEIIPMRYILELMGEQVGWHDYFGFAYIARETWNEFFHDAVIVNSRAYISLIHVLTLARHNIDIGEVGEYIELIITRG